MKSRTLSALAVAIAALVPVSAQAASVVVTWNNAALEEVRRARLGPPVVARALAIAHTCIYDAWTSYDPVAIGAVVTTLRRPAAEATDANKSKAVSFAAYRCLLNLFPAGATRLDAVMRGLGYDPLDTSTASNTPQGIGNAAAAAVIANRRNDGSNQYGDLAAGAYADYTGFVPANPPMPFCLPTTPGICPLNITDPFHWQPLINDLGATQSFVAPHWENVRPFALGAAAQFDTRAEVAAGPAYLQSAAAYQADMNDMLAHGAALSPQRKLIVEYWADGPLSELPPGHWSLFAQHVSQRDLMSIDQDVKMFFAMQNASFDAGIVAWHLKRKYNGVRPITSIRNFYKGVAVTGWAGPGQPVSTIDGGKWTPYNPGSNLTPSFPGWVSGHSTFSAASATVLRSFTGSDTFGYSTTLPANFGRVEAGVPPVPTVINFPTFSAAVAEAGLSRLYAGIHYSDDNTVGQLVGNLTGQEAWARARYLFDGGLTTAGSSVRKSAASRVFSWQHTVGTQNDRLLLVGVTPMYWDNAVYSVSYAGRALSRLGYVYNQGTRVEMWYLKAPPSGLGTVSVTLSYSDDVVAGALNAVGVNQATPFGTLRTAWGYGSQACITLANEPAPLVVSMMATTGDAGTVSAATAGQVQMWNAVSDPGGIVNFNDVIGTAMAGPGAPMASVCEKMTWGRAWDMLGVPLKPAR